MSEPSAYFLSIRHLWVDKNFKSTDKWEEAEFIMEGSLPVRINKPDSAYAKMMAFARSLDEN